MKPASQMREVGFFIGQQKGVQRMEQKPQIEIRGLCKDYPIPGGEVHALSNISLTIDKGDIYGIIGMSGAGKSTLIRCLNRLDTPTDGQIFIDGENILAMNKQQLRQTRRRMAMIFQQFNLLMQKSVARNVRYPLEIAGVPKKQANERVIELLRIVGLEDKAGAYPAQLSGGQKQRVAVAGVLAMQPEVMILDEATAMLDPSGRADVLATVRKLNREQGMTVIWITHFMEEAAVADRVVVLDKGKIALDGTPAEVFSQVQKVKALGLDVPPMAELAMRLNAGGLRLPDGILTVADMVKELKKALCPSK